MNEKLPKAWGAGPVRFANIELDCYILEDGTPILNKGKMMKAIGRAWKGSSRTDLPNFIGAKNLLPYVKDELRERLNGINFLYGNQVISGYHADVLVLVCNVYLEAREAHALKGKPQLRIAQQCEILLRSFAKVGITALIYEQLGYERFKNPEALRILVESYLVDEVREYSKEFPDEFFQQLDKIYGHERTTSRNRPLYYAKFIRKYIYDPFERGEVLKRLDEKNPLINKKYRKHRFHSWLSTDLGLQKLRSQVWQVVAILKTSSGKRTFESGYNRMMGQSNQRDLFEE
jgi:hypothetical protein